MSNSIILTTYFSKKIHPNDPNDQHVVGKATDGRVWQNDINYIMPWYSSIHALGLNGIVFYDNLTTEFVEKYENKNIKFYKAEESKYQTYHWLNNPRSNHDWRWFVYRDYLKNHTYDSVFFTDSSDVYVIKNPNKIIEDYPTVDLFVCKDNIKLCHFPYLDVHKQAKWDNYSFFAMEHLKGQIDLINMGVIGGKYEQTINFLDKFCLTRSKMGNINFSADMWIGQYVFRHLLADKKILIGEPFTSKFKKYEIDRKDVYFIHK